MERTASVLLQIDQTESLAEMAAHERSLSTLSSDLNVQLGHVSRLDLGMRTEERANIMLKALNSQLRFDEARSLAPDQVAQNYSHIPTNV
ncbi:MAG TPA: hypothetical protein VLE91_01210 [Candidatus Saccharimonadales bacterium]|nr:hypothetical protein [Candidatus Saccharimonadales bacterium]